MGFVTQLLHSQFRFTPPYPTHDFSGQTVIVTGSNVGLGFEAARHFARLNCAKLILAVRTISKGEEAKESILATTKRTDDCIEVWPLDLLSHESVKAFAKRAQSLERIDVLLENAGIAGIPKFSLHDGFEKILQTNVINTLLLALLLLPKLRETAEKNKTIPHLSIVASEMHHTARFSERDAPNVYAALNEEKKFNAFDR
jgi:retinol dehydrogenase 12